MVNVCIFLVSHFLVFHFVESADETSSNTDLRSKESSKPKSTKGKQHEATKKAIKTSNVRGGDKLSSKGSKTKSEIKSKLLCKHGSQPGHSSKDVCTFCCAR